MQNWGKKRVCFGHIDKFWKGHDAQIKKNACKKRVFRVYFHTMCLGCVLHVLLRGWYPAWNTSGHTPPPRLSCRIKSDKTNIYIIIRVKVGVNHGFFHFYHFWNFLIFKSTWVCSSSSSKNKNIFLNLSINSINLNMSIYLSYFKNVFIFIFAGKSSLRAYS